MSCVEILRCFAYGWHLKEAFDLKNTRNHANSVACLIGPHTRPENMKGPKQTNVLPGSISMAADDAGGV